MGSTAPGMQGMLGKRMDSPQCFILSLSHRLKETMSHVGLDSWSVSETVAPCYAEAQ